MWEPQKDDSRLKEPPTSGGRVWPRRGPWWEDGPGSWWEQKGRGEEQGSSNCRALQDQRQDILVKLLCFKEKEEHLLDIRKQKTKKQKNHGIEEDRKLDYHQTWITMLYARIGLPDKIWDAQLNLNFR